MTQCSRQLDLCQKALYQFLEDKRLAFPRFYFVGDDDLLELLAQPKHVPTVQQHLHKLFAGVFAWYRHTACATTATTGVASVEVVDGCVVHVCSAEGEVLPLLSPLPMTDAAEQWLADLAQALRTALQVCVLCIGMPTTTTTTRTGWRAFWSGAPGWRRTPGSCCALRGPSTLPSALSWPCRGGQTGSSCRRTSRGCSRSTPHRPGRPNRCCVPRPKTWYVVVCFCRIQPHCH